MKRSFRLARSNDFQRVRRFGRSYAHPLVVLVALPNTIGQTRFGVVAGRAVGNAVRRNRAKRLLRAVLQPNLAEIAPGWDVILIARRTMSGSTYWQVQAALVGLLRRARLLQEHDERKDPKQI
ncbi:MAG: ribonuclease P protein component [Chloroflexota bacterium]